jgi:hypothetical protein
MILLSVYGVHRSTSCRALPCNCPSSTSSSLSTA